MKKIKCPNGAILEVTEDTLSYYLEAGAELIDGTSAKKEVEEVKDTKKAKTID